MSAVDFVLYCTGISTVLVSLAVAVRLVKTGGQSTKTNKDAGSPPKWEPVPDPGGDLSNRLQAFQSARYASPIVQRQMGPDVNPPRPAIRPIRPIAARPKPPATPPPATPIKRPASQDDKVVPLPIKMKKDKED